MAQPEAGVGGVMFPSVASLGERARWSLALQASAGGGLVGGVAVAIAERSLSGSFSSGSGPIGVATAISTALLSLVVLLRTLRAAEPLEAARRALVGSFVAGVANTTVAFYLVGLATLFEPGRVLRAADVVTGVFVGVIVAVPGLLVSVPLAAVFGIAYAFLAAASVPDTQGLHLSSAARAQRRGALFLALSSLVAGLGAWLGGVGGVPLAAVLGGTFLVALASGVLAMFHELRVGALGELLRRDRHPRLELVDPDLAQVPDGVLRLGDEADRPRAVVVRADLAPYRERRQAVALLGAGS